MSDTPPNYAPRKGLSEAEIREMVEGVIKDATLEEKVAMMSGRGFMESMQRTNNRWGAEPYQAGGGCERLGAPAFYFTDGPRGVARGNSTCFPTTMARGASWDCDLEQRIGEAMGKEIRAQDCNLSGAVCINLLRHPGWGRAQETYGEDPYHLGEMGAALSTGIQTHNVAATVKHFAVNSIENSRFKVDVKVDDRTLREVYLPHFKRVLDSGCATVMSAYNKMNGEYCGQNHDLLTNILRGEWGFEGFVHSDWIFGVYKPYGAAAGLDVENPEPIYFGQNLIKSVKKGAVAPSVIDTACRRILTTAYKLLAAEDPFEAYTIDMVANEEHVALAREAAEKSAVLLTNNGVLPLRKSSNVSVFGSLATIANTGDHGSSTVRPPHVVTPLQGLSTYVGRNLTLAGDETDLEQAAAAARDAEIAIVIVGTTADDEGEYIPGNLSTQSETSEEKSAENAGPLGSGKDRGGDRRKLRLPDHQQALVDTVTENNPNTIVVLVCGSAIICDWADKAGAILQTFYAGMEGGTALANLLYGEVNPSGKLPFSVAYSEADYPFFDPDADEIEYGPLHGYTLLESTETEPMFWFGHGLSYTQFSYRALKARTTAEGIDAEVTLVNTGDTAGTEISQLYIGFPGDLVYRPNKLLRGFERTTLALGARKTIRFHVPLEQLKYYDTSTGTWRIEPGTHTIHVGGTSDPAALLNASVTI
ncbi:beta-glucosidase family protein [Hyphomonas atlantica corrig.]|uniref:beta-glucosidase family protein n=1 Tax=Hyphomonas atlantica TaxID=1280948 RepID=UPI002356037B|nr:glycoside hydrolase family 3 C-terminal domain-containing protein [Hyphomonas atlantica]